MKLTLEPTDKLVTVNGVEARIWQGYSDKGVAVCAYITRLQVPEGFTEDFERELAAKAAPRPEVQAIPLRMLL